MSNIVFNVQYIIYERREMKILAKIEMAATILCRLTMKSNWHKGYYIDSSRTTVESLYKGHIGTS